MHATELNVTTTAYLALRVDNRERNVQIPLDDLAGGFNVTLGWR